jgi:glyoxylase-like metal-dependent hydrolase (beta-lactamase superfamily II)
MPDSLCYKITPVTAYAQNSSLLWCADTKEAAFVDPGGDIEKLQQAATDTGVKPVKILLTHGHIDHVGFTAELAEKTGLPVIGPHEQDRFLLESLDEYGAMLGLPHSGNFTPDRWLCDGDKVTLGNQTLEVIHCPGHTPGHVVFYHAPSKLAVVGDVLFQHSIGRTDFPRGNHEDLLHSIKHKLIPLGDDIEFIPGHGPNSSFGEERLHNPFLLS